MACAGIEELSCNCGKSERSCQLKTETIRFRQRRHKSWIEPRLDDMLARYGEVCTQKVAAQLLNVVAAHHSPNAGRGALAPGGSPGGRALHLRVHREPQTGQLCGQGEEYPSAQYDERERFLCRGPAGADGHPGAKGGVLMAKKTPSGKFRGKVTIGYAPGRQADL